MRGDMNETLELHNSPIIFSRAKEIISNRLGPLSEDMINNLRKLFLSSSWKIEARHFRMMREHLDLSQSEVAEDLNITLADLRKLEKSVDFFQRDVTAEALKSYLQLQFN
jgi:DNA-binding transcriptional regulator YiaG